VDGGNDAFSARMSGQFNVEAVLSGVGGEGLPNKAGHG
jgi:hypothetical protein